MSTLAVLELPPIPWRSIRSSSRREACRHRGLTRDHPGSSRFAAERTGAPTQLWLDAAPQLTRAVRSRVQHMPGRLATDPSPYGVTCECAAGRCPIGQRLPRAAHGTGDAQASPLDTAPENSRVDRPPCRTGGGCCHSDLRTTVFTPLSHCHSPLDPNESRLKPGGRTWHALISP
jgi:hypothetical protein